MGSLTSKDPEQEARNIALNDPMARPTQVAWTSARASHCGFIFDPARLRANYMAAEMQAGNPPEQMEKIERAYDYTLQSVTDIIKDELRYCSPERTAAIRIDLNRYLAGDYTPSARWRARASVWVSVAVAGNKPAQPWRRGHLDPDRVGELPQRRLVALAGEEIGNAGLRPRHAAKRAVTLERRRGSLLAFFRIERERRAARAEVKQLRQRLVAGAQELRPHETQSLAGEVGHREIGADGLRELEGDEVAIALTSRPTSTLARLSKACARAASSCQLGGMLPT